MHRVLVLGAGKIGRMICSLLSSSGDYSVRIADGSAEALDRWSKQTHVETLQVDAANDQALAAAMADCDTVISALSFRFNPGIARQAIKTGLNYLDLTEDVETTRQVCQAAQSLKDSQMVMPQCGLAPGFISIVARDLTKWFDELETVHMRVGALPQYPSNALKYNLTWSTDGLINEYCNPCEAIHDSQLTEVLPLEGLEHFSLDGVRYEAFNTSGGLGSLCTSLLGTVRELNYKTIRYLGHRDLMSFLVDELLLNKRRDVLKDILESAIPVTFQDVVVVFCTVTGYRNGQLVQRSDARKIYSDEIDGEIWSAIQITTAAGVCASLDLFREGKLAPGLRKQEEIDLADFLANRFGQYYRFDGGTRLSRT